MRSQKPHNQRTDSTKDSILKLFVSCLGDHIRHTARQIANILHEDGFPLIYTICFYVAEESESITSLILYIQ